MNPNLERAMQDAVNIHKQRRQIAKLVDHLITILRIPDGSHLVPFFGNGYERDNRQALASWVEKHINEIDPNEAEQRLRLLANGAAQALQEQ